MPAPEFNLPVFGSAPNQYSTENALEAAIQAVINALWNEAEGKATIANSGKIFNTRSGAVAAGQTALTPALAMIMTRSGDYMELRLPGATGDDPLFDTSPYWGVALRLPSSAIVDGKADIGNSGKSFPSRAAIVAFGQENLPQALGLISAREGDYIVYRSPTAIADDPLFDTPGPRWGVLQRVPAQSLVARLLIAAGEIPLESVGGTANDITASIPTWLADAGISITRNSVVRVVIATANTGPVTLHVAGDEPRPVIRPNGQPLEAGDLLPLRGMVFRRSGVNWRLHSAGVEASQLGTAAYAALDDMIRRTNMMHATVPRFLASGPGNAMVLTPASGLPNFTVGSFGLIQFNASGTSTAADPTITIDGVTRVLKDAAGAALPAGAIRNSQTYIASIRNTTEARLFAGQGGGVDLAPLWAEINDKASQASVASLSAVLDGKAAKDDLDALELVVDGLLSGTRVVGDWDASGGSFPAARPNASPVQAGDQFNVSDGGTVDGVVFSAGDILTALVDGGGATYAGIWSHKVGFGGLSTQIATPEPGVSVQDRLDYSETVFGGRAAVMARHVPHPVSTLTWADHLEAPEVVRTADPDKSCLTTADGAIWMPKGHPTPLHFGAVGDGVTDDTAAFQAFIDHVKRWSLEGRIPAGFMFRVVSVNMWSSQPYGMAGDGCRQSYILVSNPDRTSAGLKFTHPTDPTQRGGGGIIMSDFGLLSAPGNKAVLYEDRYCSGLKMQRLELRPQPGAGSFNDTKHQMMVLSKCWNVDLNEVSVWAGGVNLPVFTVPSVLKFTAALDSDIISTSDGSSFFTAGMVGKYLTLMSASLNQTFLVQEFISPTQIRVDVVSESNFLAASGCFGGVRGSMDLASSTLQIEQPVLTEDDIGRRVYVVGADVNAQNVPFPLWARVVAVDGMNITLDAPAGRAVAMAELIFDPAVDFGTELARSTGNSNDFKFNDLHIEHYSGTALVISGNKVDGSGVKIHAKGVNDINDMASNIQVFGYYWNGYLSGGFVQRVAGNRMGRILLTSQTAPTYLGSMHTLLYSKAPLIKMHECSVGAHADVEGVYHIEGSTTQSMLNEAYSVSGGSGSVRFGSIGGVGRPPLLNPGFSLPTYTITALPAPAAGPGPVFVSDSPGGMAMAFSDGVNWRRISDGGVVA